MGRFSLDLGITKDLKSISSDSFTDNVKMVDIDDIAPSTDNFYSLVDIDILADDIERQGLKHNLVLLENEKSGIKSEQKFTIESGHRRYAAIKLLIEQGRRSSRLIPAYIAVGNSVEEIKMNLIMLNATTRVLTDAEKLEQYRELDKVMKSLKEKGKPVNGRIRDRISDILKISPAQVGKMENVEHNAIPAVQQAISRGEMSISTANEIAKLDVEAQEEIISQSQPTEITHKAVKKIVDKNNGKDNNQSECEVDCNTVINECNDDVCYEDNENDENDMNVITPDVKEANKTVTLSHKQLSLVIEILEAESNRVKATEPQLYLALKDCLNAVISGRDIL